jgi:SMODS and SLOG-associating 2TM effector domain
MDSIHLGEEAMAPLGTEKDNIQSHIQDHGSNAASSTGDTQKNLSSHDSSPTTKEQHLQKLRTFQDLVGIRTPYHILSTGSTRSKQIVDLEKGQKPRLPEKGPDGQDIPYAAGRPSRSVKDFFFRSHVKNDGIYGRAIDEALAASVWFNFSNFFINALYCLQIFIAATITALASYHGHEIPLTVLGATNAVLAGLMALLKGQGLPVRMRRSRDQFQNVMKTIENKERMFARFVHMDIKDQNEHDPFKESQLCEHLFDAAKSDQQASKSSLAPRSRVRSGRVATDEMRALQITRTCIPTAMRGLRCNKSTIVTMVCSL